MLYKVIVTFESRDEILNCDRSNESYCAVLFCGAFYYVVQGDCNVWVCGWNPKAWLIQTKSTAQYFPVVFSIMLYKVIVAFASRNEILHCDWFKWKLPSSILSVVLFIILYKVILTPDSLDEILKCDHSNENVICKVARFRGVVSYASKRWF